MGYIIQTTYLRTGYGELVIGSFGERLCLCDWRYRKQRDAIDERIQTGLHARYEEGRSDIIDETARQLTHYFKGERTTFNLPLLMVGSDFQKRVWDTLLQIPFGSTETYLGLSQRLGDEKAIRAVAAANGANAISIIVPCHRILGSDGRLTGYAGGLATKRKLLRLENAFSQQELDFPE